MLRHYLTFAHQAAALEEALAGWTLAECWSQEKNVLLLRFVQGRESRFVEAALDLRQGYALLNSNASRARKNTIDFFGELLGATVSEMTIDDGERIIRFHFESGGQLALLFFGPGSGNALVLSSGRVASAFQKYEAEYDSLLFDGAEGEHLTQPELIAALRKSDDPLQRALQRALPMLGKRLATEALFRTQIPANLETVATSDEQLTALLAVVDEVYQQCELSTEYFLYYLRDEIVFSLTRLLSLEGLAVRTERFGDIARAIRAFRSESLRYRKVRELREALSKKIGGEMERLRRSLAKGAAISENAFRADEWEKNGSRILANIHTMLQEQSKLVGEDYDGTQFEITLDVKLTPAQNAERIFRRARNAREAVTQNDRQRGELERRLEFIGGLAAELEAAKTMEDLVRLESKSKGVATQSGAAKEKGTADRFRSFTIGGGLEVYAGKNAANNDELTVKFAKPNDYWFHARGSSGSHVVLRWSDSKTKPPKDALREAAEIAAYYSGARNAKYVPVAYALKKFVRKPKGAAPGAVLMERELVMMVEPKLPHAE